jgi:oligopeptide/dipeptide ABC transporter ATP-binding protein
VLGFILRRFLQAVLVMVVIVLLGVYAIGNPIDIVIPPEATAEIRAEAIRCPGLDRPLHEQYFIFISNLLQGDLGLTCVFLSHDLSVVQHLSDRVAVMYLGRIVEPGPVAQVFGSSAHPYTAALFGSVPKLVLDADELVHSDAIDGEVPSPLSPPSGCAFHPRCPLPTATCASTPSDRRTAWPVARGKGAPLGEACSDATGRYPLKGPQGKGMTYPSVRCTLFDGN